MILYNPEELLIQLIIDFALIDIEYAPRLSVIEITDVILGKDVALKKKLEIGFCPYENMAHTNNRKV